MVGTKDGSAVYLFNRSFPEKSETPAFFRIDDLGKKTTISLDKITKGENTYMLDVFCTKNNVYVETVDKTDGKGHVKLYWRS